LSATAVTILRLVLLGVMVTSTWPLSVSLLAIRMLSLLLWCDTRLFLPRDLLALLSLVDSRFFAASLVSLPVGWAANMLWLSVGRATAMLSTLVTNAVLMARSVGRWRRRRR
jgi:signal transduction histidine kinase